MKAFIFFIVTILGQTLSKADMGNAYYIEATIYWDNKHTKGFFFHTTDEEINEDTQKVFKTNASIFYTYFINKVYADNDTLKLYKEKIIFPYEDVNDSSIKYNYHLVIDDSKILISKKKITGVKFHSIVNANFGDILTPLTRTDHAWIKGKKYKKDNFYFDGDVCDYHFFYLAPPNEEMEFKVEEFKETVGNYLNPKEILKELKKCKVVVIALCSC